MTADKFRSLALSLPGASEGGHMGHSDFRVNGRIFATLGYPDIRFGVILLPLEDQQQLLQSHPKVFSPAKGAWGRGGSTQVLLSAARVALVCEALTAAWRKRAPQG